MIRWFLRGVIRRRVTTRYPDAEEPAPRAFRGEQQTVKHVLLASKAGGFSFE